MNRQPVQYPAFEGEVVLLVSHREIETNGVFVFGHFFQHDIFQGKSELFTGVILLGFETPDDQSFQFR